MQQQADGLGKGVARPPGCKDNFIGWLCVGHLGAEQDSRMLASRLACHCATRAARPKSDGYTCRTARRRLADGGSNPPSSTKPTDQGRQHQMLAAFFLEMQHVPVQVGVQRGSVVALTHVSYEPAPRDSSALASLEEESQSLLANCARRTARTGGVSKNRKRRMPAPEPAPATAATIESTVIAGIHERLARSVWPRCHRVLRIQILLTRKCTAMPLWLSKMAGPGTRGLPMVVNRCGPLLS